MTTLTEANEALAQRFIDTWTPTGHAYTLENEDFTAPDNAPWARFSSRINASTQETLGQATNRKFERSGSCFVQIYVREKTGTKVSKQLAQTVVDGFEGARIVGTTVRFTDAIPRETGPDGKWYQTVVEINFVFDETK